LTFAQVSRHTIDQGTEHTHFDLDCRRGQWAPSRLMLSCCGSALTRLNGPRVCVCVCVPKLCRLRRLFMSGVESVKRCRADAMTMRVMKKKNDEALC